MKILSLLIVLVLVGCGPSPATQKVASIDSPKVMGPDGCNVETSSKLANEHRVGKITNLVKDKVELGALGHCTVKFDLTVNGQTYHLEESEEGLEQLESLCHYAKERARKELLLDLAGDFKSETNIICRQTDRS